MCQWSDGESRSDAGDQSVKQLSGGERRRVALARLVLGINPLFAITNGCN